MFIYRQHLFFLQFSFIIIIIISIRLSKILFLPNWIELKWNDLEQTKQNKTKQIFWLIENYIIQFVCQKNAYFHSVVRQFGNWGHSERREREKIYRSSLKKSLFSPSWSWWSLSVELNLNLNWMIDIVSSALKERKPVYLYLNLQQQQQRK